MCALECVSRGALLVFEACCHGASDGVFANDVWTVMLLSCVVSDFSLKPSCGIPDDGDSMRDYIKMHGEWQRVLVVRVCRQISIVVMFVCTAYFCVKGRLLSSQGI